MSYRIDVDINLKDWTAYQSGFHETVIIGPNEVHYKNKGPNALNTIPLQIKITHIQHTTI